LKAKLQDALIGQVADDFMDISTPLKALSDAAMAPFGREITDATVYCYHNTALAFQYVVCRSCLK
jgi:hypothetical protein